MSHTITHAPRLELESGNCGASRSPDTTSYRREASQARARKGLGYVDRAVRLLIVGLTLIILSGAHLIQLGNTIPDAPCVAELLNNPLAESSTIEEQRARFDERQQCDGEEAKQVNKRIALWALGGSMIAVPLWILVKRPVDKRM